MSPKVLIALRVLGIALLVFAAIRLAVDVARSIQTEQHATATGYDIDHVIEIPHTTLFAGLAGAALVGLSFIRGRKEM